MGLPEPPSSLDGSCSVVWGGTLYSYTPSAFLSLKLSEGAKWETLNMGESVTGGTCVGSTADSANAGFFVIGGTGGSTGLLKYTFSTGNWSAIHPGDSVVKDRLGHSSAYIKSKDSILVFGGGKDGQAGQETFLIKASEPYSVIGVPASAPAALKPILLPWGDSSAFMISGDTNTNVYQFNPDAQTWSYSGSSLAEPVTAQVKGALVTGTDGSENLFLFDLSQTPNKISRAVIRDANGLAVPSSPYITSRDLEDLSSNEKRDSAWPSYNATQAPNYVRTNYAIAQGSDGQVYFTGGSSEESISIFSPMANSWVDTEQLLVSEKDTKSAPTSASTSASATSTSISSSTSSTVTSSSPSVSTTFTTSAISTTASTSTQASSVSTTGNVSSDASSDKQNKSDDGLSSNVVLGISLGSIFAFLLLLGLIFCLLRRHRMRRHKEMAQAREFENMRNDEKNPNAFGNESSSAPPGYFRGHRANESQDSFSSMAILMGRLNNNKSSGLSRKGSKGSNRSSVSSLHKQLKSTISKPIPQVNSNPIMASSPAPAYGRAVGQERSLTGGQPRAPGMTLAVPEAEEEMRGSSGWDRYWSGGSALQVLGFGQKRSTVVSEHSSHYSQNSGPNQASRVTQDSATVPPLNIEGRASYARVNSGNVIVTGNSHQVPLPGGLSGKIERPVSKASSGYSSGVPESVTDVWEAATGSKAWGTERAPSSAYNSTFSLGGAIAQQQDYSGSRPHRSGVSTQPQLAMASKSSDMSWLNIGALDPSRKQ